MSSSTLFRWAGLSAVVGGVLVIVGELIHPANQASRVASSTWMTAHVILLASLVFGIAGMFGIYLKQVRESGGLGFLGFLLIFVAMALFIGVVYFEAFFNPLLVTEAPAFVEKWFTAEPPGPLAVLLPLNGIAFSLGWLLFGIALVRANVLPRWAAILATVGAVPFGLEAILPAAVGKIAAVLFGVGVIWLGYALWSERTTMAPAGAPAARQRVAG